MSGLRNATTHRSDGTSGILEKIFYYFLYQNIPTSKMLKIASTTIIEDCNKTTTSYTLVRDTSLNRTQWKAVTELRPKMEITYRR